MSLLNKASIITTPTAYAEDYLYSIKPAIPFGNELVTNGNFYSNSDWNLDSGWSISGGKLIATNTALEATQTNVFTTNKTYEITFTIDSISSGSVKIKAGTTNGTIRTTAGTYTQVLTVSSGTSLVFDMHSSGSCVIDNVSAKEVTDADFDFDRNSTGTRVNEDYLIEDVPYNLTTYSEDFSQWTLNGDSVVLQSETYLGRPIYKLTDASGTLGIYNDSAGNIVGQTYTISLIAKKDTSNLITLRYGSSNNKNVQFNLDTGVITSEASGVTGAIQNLGNGFYQISSTIASLIHSTISFAIYTSNGSVLITSAQIVKGDQPKEYLKTTDRLDIPRIDYTNGEPSILLEPSRTNSFDYSQDFSDTYWDKVGVTIGSNVATSPEGITNAFKIKEKSGSYHNINWDGSVTSGTTYTVSVFLKASERTTASIYENVGIGGGTYPLSSFNLVTGKVDSENTNHTANIENYGNGWFRCSITFTPDASSSGSIYIAPNNTLTYTGVTDNGVFIYGAQLEAGSYATSLIHTSGSAVTRSADAANNAGNSDLINSTEGVLYAEIKSFIETPTHRRTIALSDGTSAVNVVRILYLNNTANNILGQVRANNTLTASIDKTVSTTLEYHKVAVKYKENDFALWVDGEQVNTDTSVAVPSANTMLRLDFSDGNNSNKFNEGEIKMVAVFKEALTDLELEKLTGYNNHELYMNYYNRLSYLGLAEEYNVESDINNYIL